jgi:hypothetical protein
LVVPGPGERPSVLARYALPSPSNTTMVTGILFVLVLAVESA